MFRLMGDSEVAISLIGVLEVLGRGKLFSVQPKRPSNPMKRISIYLVEHEVGHNYQIQYL